MIVEWLFIICIGGPACIERNTPLDYTFKNELECIRMIQAMTEQQKKDYQPECKRMVYERVQPQVIDEPNSPEYLRRRSQPAIR